MNKTYAALLLVLVFGFGIHAEERNPQVVRAKHGVVVGVSQPGSEAGLKMLQRGGNSVDAAVATALAMAVTVPEAGNIGGGGFMMILPGPGKPPVCIEYRETAPAAATENMFPLNHTRFGHRVVGVPGTLRGLELAHKKYGKLPWKQLVVPAVQLARDGFEIDAFTAKSLNKVLAGSATKRFAEFQRVFGKEDKKPWAKGDRLIQPDLAKTFQLIADQGADAFYRGRIAGWIAEEMQAGGGLITKQDLANYEAKLRRPIKTSYRGYDVFGAALPSSGGTTMGLMLNMLENFELRKQNRWSPATAHIMIEVMRRAYLDRARHLGDADFVKIPEQLYSKQYAQQLAKSIDLNKETRSEYLARDIPLADESPSTTHFSVADSSGMAVSNTYTLEFSYGSRVVVRGAGFLLNNEMGDFNWKRGHTDRKGRIGTKANLIQPGKRMLSSQTPTLVTKDGKFYMATGSPGGRTIINTALGVVLNRLEFGMSLKDAVAAPRLHHQWFPDVARFEDVEEAKFAPLVQQIKARGHQLNDKAYIQGDAHSIGVDEKTGRLIGVADDRRSGFAAGY
ncbi:MAG: gamma-glutamyltransferase [Planctomycetaceae bacterium]|nr:gamma-glutamyltransferase [Planctomycetaceae bacterium]